MTPCIKSDKIDELVKDVKYIKEKLSIGSEINTEIEITRRAKIQADELLENILKKETVKKKIDFGEIVKLLTIAFVIVLFFIFMYSGFNRINNKINDMGVPIVVRGNEILTLPADVRIKMWPDDFDKDTVK